MVVSCMVCTPLNGVYEKRKESRRGRRGQNSRRSSAWVHITYYNVYIYMYTYIYINYYRVYSRLCLSVDENFTHEKNV